MNISSGSLALRASSCKGDSMSVLAHDDSYQIGEARSFIVLPHCLTVTLWATRNSCPSSIPFSATIQNSSRGLEELLPD